MFKTADGQTLELAPWRMRRLLRAVEEARRYTTSPPPQVLIRDLRQIIGRARLVSHEPRIGTARFQSSEACCKACLLARQQGGVLQLLGISVSTAGGIPAYDRLNGGMPQQELESMPRAGNITLNWSCWPTLPTAAAKSPSSGVYILHRDNVPVYVGMSTKLGQRLREHYRCSVRVRSPGLAACVAPVSGMDALRAVEHALVRTFGGGVTNDMLQRRLRVGDNGLTIKNLLPDIWKERHPPGNLISFAAGAHYEWLP